LTNGDERFKITSKVAKTSRSAGVRTSTTSIFFPHEVRHGFQCSKVTVKVRFGDTVSLQKVSLMARWLCSVRHRLRGFGGAK